MCSEDIFFFHRMECCNMQLSHLALFLKRTLFFPQILTIRDQCSTFTRCIIMFNFSFLVVVMEHVKNQNYLLDYTQLIVFVTRTGRVHLPRAKQQRSNVFLLIWSFFSVFAPSLQLESFSFCEQMQSISSNIKQHSSICWAGSMSCIFGLSCIHTEGGLSFFSQQGFVQSELIGINGSVW